MSGRRSLWVTTALLAAAAVLLPAVGATAAVECNGRAATLVGTSGDDFLVGTTGNDVIHGLGGDDVIIGRRGRDTLCGGTGNDTIDGGAGTDSLFGSDGIDRLIGGFGADSLTGGPGSDWAIFAYRGTSGMAISLVTGSAQPNVGETWALADIDSLDTVENVIGSDGADTIVGNDGANSLRGRAGDDEITPLLGDDIAHGGTGFDWIQYFPNNVGVFVDLKAETASGSGSDTIAAFEAVWGTEFADILAGDSGANYLFGAGGNDRMYGKIGVDSLEPGLGDDLLHGGREEDWALFQSETGPVTVDLLAGIATGAGTNTLVGIESARGTDADDTLLGNAAANYFIGGPGNDDLRGRDGVDNLDPGSGNDVVRGGYGNDWIYYWTHTNGVNVDLAAGTAAGSGSDTLISVESAVGTNHADQLFGTNGPNNLWGFAGDDTVRGRGGNDFVQAAGGGTNRLIGGTGHDILRFDFFAGPVAFDLRKSTSSINGIDDLFSFEGAWGTAANDTLIGDATANTLRGLAGDDTLRGLEGDDTLDGGPGFDDLGGGPGIDTCATGEVLSSCEQVAMELNAANAAAPPRLPGPARAPGVARPQQPGAVAAGLMR